MRHTSYPLVIILLLIVTSAFQVSAKPANTRQITVEPFNAIDVSFDIYIDYTISAQNSKATLTAPAATFDSVTIKVVNKVLTVSHKYKPYKTGKRTLRIALYAPEVKSITASKSGKVKVRNNIDNASTLTLETSTSGEIITKDIACTKLIATATTSGEIETGNIDAGTGSILLTTSKSGEIELKNLNCNNAALNTSTSSEVEID
ncbi:GIN domain-containing protein, partial [uncultured Muribaculum sp.]